MGANVDVSGFTASLLKDNSNPAPPEDLNAKWNLSYREATPVTEVLKRILSARHKLGTKCSDFHLRSGFQGEGDSGVK